MAMAADAAAVAADESLDHDGLSRAWRSLVMHRGLVDDILSALAHAQGEAADDELLSALPERVARAAEAAAANAAVLERAAAAAGAPARGLGDESDEAGALGDAARDLPRVCAALRACAADWGALGEPWRKAAYTPVVEAVTAAAGDAVAAGDAASVASFRVLVPGAGLGRLAWELARRGAAVQGAEADYVLLFLANFLLNGDASERAVVFPAALRVDGAAVEEGEEIPDVDPSSLSNEANFSMCAGDFLSLYNEKEAWHCVATCLFLEREKNTLAIVKRIAKLLKVGGVWVNHGTLDYEGSRSSEEPVLALSEEELFNIIPRLGMRVIARERRRITRLATPDDVVIDEFESLFFVAVRV